MKGYRKSGGWLYRCDGGPLDSQHIRGYNQIKKHGEWVDAELDWDFTVQGNTEGRYVLEPLNLATGERRKAKHKGIETDAFHYVWYPN